MTPVRHLLVIVLLMASGAAAAEEVPLPRPRPTIPVLARAAGQFGVPLAAAAVGPRTLTTCRLRLSKIAQFFPLSAIDGPGECGAKDLVKLRAVRLPDKAHVTVNPPATLNCRMAESVSHWAREAVAPAVAALGALRQIENYDSYDCRGRNRVVGAKISEHGKGNALDVRGFKLAGGRMVKPTDVHIAKDLRAELKSASCARFTTVLGPGSDGYHETHVHLDLAQRRNGYRLCHWEVWEPGEVIAGTPANVPLPRPRPISAAHELARANKL